MTDIYSVFATYYDQLMDNYDYQSVFTFIEDVLKKEKKDPGAILEMACGTGKLTEKLTGLGQVHAFDRSEQMLAQAYQRLYRNKRAKIFEMDMVNFSLNKKFDTIVCLCDSLNYLDSMDKIKSTFERVKAHLATDGVFIFDMNTDYRFREVYGDHIQIEEGEDFYFSWTNHYEEDKKRNLYSLNFFLEEKGLYRRMLEEHYEYVYEEGEVLWALEEAGLMVESIRNGYSENEDVMKAERLVYIVKNKENK